MLLSGLLGLLVLTATSINASLVSNIDSLDSPTYLAERGLEARTKTARLCTRHSQCKGRPRPTNSNYKCQEDGSCAVSPSTFDPLYLT